MTPRPAGKTAKAPKAEPPPRREAHPDVLAATFPVPASSVVDYVCAQGEVLLLRVNAPGRPGRLDLAVFFADAASAKRGVSDYFDGDSSLADTLRALGAATLVHMDLDAGSDGGWTGESPHAKPLAVLATSTGGSALPAARLTQTKDAVAAYLSSMPRRSTARPMLLPAMPKASPRPVAPPAAPPPVAKAPAPAPSAVPVPTAAKPATARPAVPERLSVSTEGKGRDARVELVRGDEGVTVSAPEVPSLLSALEAAFPGCLPKAVPTRAEPASKPAAPTVPGMPPVDRAMRVIRARLYAGPAEGIAWDALAASVEATGLTRDAAESARSLLLAEGAVAQAGETLSIPA